MSMATDLMLGLAAVILALFLITGYLPSSSGPLFIRRKTDPGPYWLGIGFYAFALLVVVLIVAVRAARGLPT